jgi:hypothetical protein
MAWFIDVNVAMCYVLKSSLPVNINVRSFSTTRAIVPCSSVSIAKNDASANIMTANNNRAHNEFSMGSPPFPSSSSPSSLMLPPRRRLLPLEPPRRDFLLSLLRARLLPLLLVPSVSTFVATFFFGRPIHSIIQSNGVIQCISMFASVGVGVSVGVVYQVQVSMF